VVDEEARGRNWMRSAQLIFQDFVGSVSHQPGKKFDRMKSAALHQFPDGESARALLSENSRIRLEITKI
jgi:hypothetical protein